MNRTNPNLLLASRGVRAFGDGFTALVLPAYLTQLGFSPFQVGLVTTATLLGSAALTLAVSLLAHHVRPRAVLIVACGLMLATGLAFAGARGFWPILLVGFAGTLNPSNGDVSLFLPMEQALVAHAATSQNRTALFARFSLIGSLAAAGGALCVGAFEPLGRLAGLGALDALRAAFVLYGLLAILALGLYLRLPKDETEAEAPRAPLGPSRAKVLKLATLFSLDSFGGGFLVQSMMALWLFHRFGLSLAAAGGFFFWTGILSAVSMLAAGPLARRIGLVNTMVFTHIPANLCVIAAAFTPSLPAVLTLLLVRSALSNMDVPARTSYVMAIVTPAERAAAAGVTNIPRSLASAVSPSLAGLLLGAAGFAWPLAIGGGLKVAYDLILLGQFGRVRPPEEAV